MDVLKFKSVIDESELASWQVLASELDSTIEDMRCYTLSCLRDAYEIEQFNGFWDYVTHDEAVVVGITEDANLYELSDDSTLVILYGNINDRMIIFDKQDKRSILSKITKF